jgi:exodeoxyribonuclease VII small subunit
MSTTKKAAAKAAPDDVAVGNAPDAGADSLSYEQARAELASVVERLESGGTSLEESLALWERGEQLAGVCQRWLDGARQRLDAARRSRPTDS